ncbi:ras-related GTP-binding protein-like protein raga [Wallemia mellicola CBS 633.66]|uniref:GTP-binding protein n=1 Tax=Wallemia mellicola (strain ATCC MYA-4683 / CBS 633.66) TaxID=671144 RepID=I4YB52_WALMC|nr:ras-related GTP-binding protein-like protein raga [Wallemia mellicola CBS 633.66]EIM21194.1 ras-related GTP-binding protein-like protein raga [Wallemia mellicola CBS 633.66]TIC31637.1 ras-related GTP-binding protein-like protein raga [Wallemia mellicola]|eukprot:XP_006958866.1 ras-related GTP-binding protein-like protein raga [Wallemia mellicola CBS 633.66]
MKKKVLLMGKSGSGKTSMRSIIFNSQSSDSTSTVQATLSIEAQSLQLLSSLSLNIWDCGGQTNFLSSYISHQRADVFKDVGVLIYVFDVTTPTNQSSDELSWFSQCLEGLKEYRKDNDSLKVFILVNKMDLVSKQDIYAVFNRRRNEIFQSVDQIIKYNDNIEVECFMTSIWDQSLYKAWSKIVTKLLPSSSKMTGALTHFARQAHATEVVLFERTTFLVIGQTTLNKYGEEEIDLEDEDDNDEEYINVTNRNIKLSRHRFEKISQLIKSFKHSCSKLNNQFNSMQISEKYYNAVLEPLTVNTYILVITDNTNISPSAIQMNIRLAKPYFEKVEHSFIDTNTASQPTSSSSSIKSEKSIN